MHVKARLFLWKLATFIWLFAICQAIPAENPPSGQTVEAFLNAIQEDDTHTALAMLAADTNLVRATYYGRLPLHVAASMGRAELVQELIKKGADINAAGDTLDTINHGITSLAAAIWYGHSNVCSLLLEAGADPDIQSLVEGSALNYAITYRRPEMAAWLLDYGADPFPEMKNALKATPLEATITLGDGRLVPRMLGQDRSNPLGIASRVRLTPDIQRERNESAARLLAERGPMLLATAARRGELEAVQALLEEGVSAKSSDEQGEPLLRGFALSHAASAKADGFDSRRWLQIRDRLIKNGADYDAFAATALGDIEHVRQLMAAEKDLFQTRDETGQTPLHWAVLSDQLPLTAFWLASGTSPAATNSAGQTALHQAASKGLMAHLDVLLAAHAPTNLRDTNGWTPLDAAIHAKQEQSIRLLLATRNAAPHPERGIATALHEAAASGNVAVLAALSEDTTNLETRNELGLTPLQVAVHRGHLAGAALLVDKGADVNARDPAGNPLLHQLLLQKRPYVVLDRPATNWLGRMGSDPRKETFLKYLTVGKYEQGPHPLLQATSLLLASGLEPGATNHAGQTAIQLVTDEEVTQWLFFFDDDQALLLRLLGTGGGNVDEADANGDTALHRAGQGLHALVNRGRVSTLRMMLARHRSFWKRHTAARGKERSYEPEDSLGLVGHRGRQPVFRIRCRQRRGLRPWSGQGHSGVWRLGGGEGTARPERVCGCGSGVQADLPGLHRKPND